MAHLLESLKTPAAFLFVLGVLVFVHELGHFLVARWYGVKVHTFSLGFGPKIFSARRGDTEYCISIVPLGGYVKLAGESSEENRTFEPDEFMSKSKWIRFQVYLAGPVMNILLAIIVLAFVLSRGADVPLYTEAAPVIGAVQPNGPAALAGLQRFDRILSVAGVETPTWDALDMAVLPKAGKALAIVVDRAGKRLDVNVTPASVSSFELGQLGIAPLVRPQVQLVSAGSPAERAGFERGDVVVAVNGEQGLTREQVIEHIRKAGDTAITFSVLRNGAPRDVSVTPAGGIIGVSLTAAEMRHVDPTLPQAFKLSVQQNWEKTVQIGQTLKGLVKRDIPTKSLVGPVGIAQLSGQAAQLGWLTLFDLMAMISLNLGLMNLLPVPVLDGGHIAILAAEGIARRDLSIKVKERIVIAGAALIAVLMVTVIFNDIARLFR